MSRHRAAPPPRYRPRYGRIAVLGLSLLTTAVGVLGGFGVLPSSAEAEESGGLTARSVAAEVAPASTPSPAPTDDAAPDDVAPVGPSLDEALDPPVPVDSGEGRRAVFSETEQRVWLVGARGRVQRTYLVSGSLTDNLQPGTYEVFSRSEDAFGIDDSGTMKWFVRFTRGPSGAAIGFHDIPVDDGARVQTRAELGTEQSHGCIRQRTADAKAMWAFAPLGTTVVVV